MLNKQSNDICCFVLDDRHRKFYIGDIFGNIDVFNASSGVHIKTVEKAGYRINSTVNKLSSEITGLKFASICGNNLLFMSTWSSKIKAFDEDNPEESSLLREARGKIMGENVKSDDDWMKIITFLAYDEHLGLITTGSNIGKIAIWDLESFKIEAFFTWNLDSNIDSKI